MQSQRHVLPWLLLLLVPFEADNHGREQDSLEQPVQAEEKVLALRNELRDRLTPVEAQLLERVESLERQLGNPWLDASVLLPATAALLGWGWALYQHYATKRQRTWELLLESLKWFEGGTQKRSIGIAVVETKWDFYPEFRARWTSILVNQAIHLLTLMEEKDRGARHERANLYRIMNLLMEKQDSVLSLERVLLAETLRDYEAAGRRGLTDLDAQRLKKWRECFRVA